MNTEILLGLPILGVILLLLFRILSKKLEPSQKWKISISAKLRDIYNQQQTKNVSEVKQVLVDLDKLLDKALQFKKVRGSTLGERLKYNRKIFTKETYDNIWKAHKTRNKIVHEFGNSYTIKELKLNNSYLKKGIEELLRK